MKTEHRVLCAAAALYVVFIARTAFTIGGETFFSLLDDGMISMRYARNLATGHGLVWNVGGPRIEGYTNFLWTIWMAALHLVPVAMSKTSLLVAASGAVVLVLNALVVARVIRQLLPRGDGVVVALGVAMVAFSFSLIYWTLRGMEVGLVVLLVSTCCYLAFALDEHVSSRRVLAFCAAIGSLTLVREDGIVSAVFIAGFVVLGAWRARNRGLIAVVLAGLVAPKAIHVLWRWRYYGNVLPNTYYLKMTGVGFAERLLHGSAVTLMMAGRSLVLPVVLVAIADRGNRVWLRDRRLRLLAALAAANILYGTYVGGDVWDWMRFPNRFATTGLIPLLILAAVAVDSIRERVEDRGRQFGLMAGTAALALCVAGGTDLIDKATSFGIASSPLGTSVSLLTMGVGLLIANRCRRESPRAWFTPADQTWRWLLILIVVLTTDGRYIGQWMVRNALGLADDIRVARLGVFLGDTTAPAATIAVAYAGAIPYFADRTSYDLTGKNDPVIAREPGKGPFRPGLNKWDYPYTILTFKPDVVADANWATLELVRLLPSWGYVGLPNGVFVRRDDPRVAWQCIGLDWSVSARRGCAPADTPAAPR
jgi:hypothetical protein